MRPCALILLLLAALPASGQVPDVQVPDLTELRTRAEATDYAETTRYDEVVTFVERVARASSDMHATTFGYTMEGRALPLVIWAKDAGPGAEALLASGKTRVLLLGNIHAGEVCGKEAALMLLRDLAAGTHAAWADSLVLLVAPIYNADGNERIRLDNRPLQHGPVGGMGQRPNAQGYDLNRDFMKVDAPETRSLLHLLNTYDPHVLVDLHTTNGTHHGYHLTYAPPLHPDTPAAIDTLLRRHWLPAVTDRMQAAYGMATYYYGNVPPPAMDAPEGWYTFDHRPRFGTNYAGLRNRFGILSEAYAYLPFRERVRATLGFVEEVLAFANAHSTAIQDATAAADDDEIAGDVLTLAARHQRSEAPVEILMGAVRETRHPYTGAPMLERKDVTRGERMDEYGTFEPTATSRAPAAYLVPPTLDPVVDRLHAHGVAMEPLAEDSAFTVERFLIDSVAVAGQTYQGHQATHVAGAYRRATVEVPAGTLLIRTGHPLGRLAFALLEPRADDGLVRWGLLSDVLEAGAFYPVWRLPGP